MTAQGRGGGQEGREGSAREAGALPLQAVVQPRPAGTPRKGAQRPRQRASAAPNVGTPLGRASLPYSRPNDQREDEAWASAPPSTQHFPPGPPTHT